MSEHSWLEEIDHTGDTGIRVTAPDLRTLFERAARAMFMILTDLENVSEMTSRSLTLDASDREELLLRWLSELNYLHITEKLLFCRFQVTELSTSRLTAQVHGEGLAEHHMVHTEIKAVTYHGLEIRETDEGWSAQVIFDM